MKILTVCQHYHPENFQITPICEQLAADGHEVTVLTGLPNYPEGTVPEEYKHGHRDEWINGVHVLRCFEIGRKKGAFCLALNYISFLLSSLWKVGKLDACFDLVFVYQLSPVLMGLPGRKYAKKYGKPLFLYCCDLWPESIKVYIKSENNPVYLFADRVSRMVYRSADRIGVQSASFLPYLQETHGIPPDRLVYLPAFADEAYLQEDFSEDNGIVDFVFLGNLGIAQDLITVLRAIEQLRDVPGFQVHFVGDGSAAEGLHRFVKEHDLGKIVYFYGRRPVEEMPGFYRLADVCMVSLRADSRVGLTLPSKVQGYMAAGKPVIGMINGSARKVIEESGCGACVAAGDAEGLAALMFDFICSPEKYAGCGAAGRKYFREHFRKETFMRGLENEIAAMTGYEVSGVMDQVSGDPEGTGKGIEETRKDTGKAEDRR